MNPRNPRAPLQAALRNRNVQAFYRAVRQGESRQDDLAYRMRFGGLGQSPKYFDSFADHPRVFEPTTGGRKSSAAGAPQVTATTWDEERRKYGWPDFSPQCQDELFVARLIYRRALDAVIAGEFERACFLCGNEWTSLPGGPEENAATSRARETYVRWGGLFEPAETPAPAAQDDAGEAIDASPVPSPQPIPQEARMEPITTAAFVWKLASGLFDVFSPLALEKLQKEVGRHTDNPEVAGRIAAGAIAKAKELTGKSDDLEAIVAAKADPAIVQKIEASVLDDLAQLAPLLEKMAAWGLQDLKAADASRDAATARAALEKHDQDPFLTRSVVFGAYGILIMAGILAGLLGYLGKSTGELVGLITTGAGLVFGAFKTRVDHRYGSSSGSDAQKVIIGELSRRK